MKKFTFDMQNNQISESMDAYFISCIKLNMDNLHFFKCFEQIIEEKREYKLSCVYAFSHKLSKLKYNMSPLILHM